MVAIEPTFCHQCSAEVQRKPLYGRERAWCPECKRWLFRNAVPSVGVLVRERDRVLLIERAAGSRVGIWAMPGAHPEYDEEPRSGAVRELEEETGLSRRF